MLKINGINYVFKKTNTYFEKLDELKAKEFYDDFLGFNIDRRHRYKNTRPGIQEMPWGTRDMSISDPFGNKRIYNEELDTDQ